MILLLHIVIALASIIVSGLVLVRPSPSKLYTSYALIVATLGSGTYLALLNPTHLPSVCVSGLLYLSVAGTMTAAAYFRLAKQTDL